MVLNPTVDPLLERLIAAWHDAEAIRDMPELFSEETSWPRSPMPPWRRLKKLGKP